MVFKEDKFYNLDVMYHKGVVYEIPDDMVQRWLKRGGQIVEDEVEESSETIEPTFHSDNDKPKARLGRKQRR